jgi:hypothetical protein
MTEVKGRPGGAVTRGALTEAETPVEIPLLPIRVVIADLLLVAEPHPVGPRPALVA